MKSLSDIPCFYITSKYGQKAYIGDRYSLNYSTHKYLITNITETHITSECYEGVSHVNDSITLSIRSHTDDWTLV